VILPVIETDFLKKKNVAWKSYLFTGHFSE
jgi:hypothetical protein